MSAFDRTETINGKTRLWHHRPGDETNPQAERVWIIARDEAVEHAAATIAARRGGDVYDLLSDLSQALTIWLQSGGYNQLVGCYEFYAEDNGYGRDVDQIAVYGFLTQVDPVATGEKLSLTGRLKITVTGLETHGFARAVAFTKKDSLPFTFIISDTGIPQLTVDFSPIN